MNIDETTCSYRDPHKSLSKYYSTLTPLIFFHRTFTDTIPTTPQTENLPDMQGSGMVRDLREAANLQTAAGLVLAAKLAQFANAGTRTEQMALLDDLIAAWGNTSGLTDMRTRAAEHGYTLRVAHLTATDEKHLLALEQFNGRPYYSMPWDDASSLEQTALNAVAANDARYGAGNNNVQLGRWESGQWRVGGVRVLMPGEENQRCA